jgi:hypothetical protein
MGDFRHFSGDLAYTHRGRTRAVRHESGSRSGIDSGIETGEWGMEMATNDVVGSARRDLGRRRFLIVSVAALAVLAVALGVSFTADTGTSSVTVSAGGGGGELVYERSGSAVTFPSGGGTVTFKAATTTTGQAPSWSPVAGSAGSVTQAGDIAVIDGRASSAGGALSVNLTLYITNLAPLQKMYGSYAFPIKIYESTQSSADFSGWSASPMSFGGQSLFYMTNTTGYLSFTLPTHGTHHKYYAVELETGGSYYTVSTTAPGGELGPSFFITAQPA